MHLGDRGIFADRAAKDDVTVASEGIHAGTADSVLCGFGLELREGGVLVESS